MKKKIKMFLFLGIGVLILGGGIWFGASKLKKKPVDVYAVSDLSETVFGESTSLEGTVTSHVSQNVRLMENQIVSQVYVQEGQEVREGDPLLSYDMTLVNIDLELEKLSKQQLEIKKKGLEQELAKLKKDKTELTVGKTDYTIEPLGTGNTGGLLAASAQRENQEQQEFLELPDNLSVPEESENPEGEVVPDDSQGTEEVPGEEQAENPEEGGTGTSGEDNMPSEEEPGEGTPGEESGTPPAEDLDTEDPDNETPPTEHPDTEAPDNEMPPTEEPETPVPSGVYQRLYGDLEIDDTIFEEDTAILENAIPYSGKGTEEEPFLFLCTKGVLIQGAFLNKIAGFTETGEREQPVYCRLEVRSEDKAEGLLQAAMVLDGGALQEPVEAKAWFLTRLGKNEWEAILPDETPDVEVPEEDLELWDDGMWMELPEDISDFIPDEEIISGYTKEELEKAIIEKEQEIKKAGLDIREADLKIKKVEDKLADETIRSTINGKVTAVGNPEKGETGQEPFISIESTEGVYVQGSVSEYLLDQVKPGQVISGFGYESGMPFEAEIKEVSPYPGNSNMYYSNRELSYYPFTAYIANSEGLKDQEMVSMGMPQEEGAITGIFVSGEFIRSKDGEDYVYKEGTDGKLVKQTVKTGRTFYGYLVEIKEGITQEDYVAFPYGKEVKENAQVERSDISKLYNSY